MTIWLYNYKEFGSYIIRAILFKNI